MADDELKAVGTLLEQQEDFIHDASVSTTIRINQSFYLIDLYKRKRDYQLYYHEVIDILFGNVIVLFLAYDRKTYQFEETVFYKRITELRKAVTDEFMRCRNVNKAGQETFQYTQTLFEALFGLETYIKQVLYINNLYLKKNSDYQQPALIRQARPTQW